MQTFSVGLNRARMIWHGCSVSTNMSVCDKIILDVCQPVSQSLSAGTASLRHRVLVPSASVRCWPAVPWPSSGGRWPGRPHSTHQGHWCACTAGGRQSQRSDGVRCRMDWLLWGGTSLFYPFVLIRTSKWSIKFWTLRFNMSGKHQKKNSEGNTG